jgi:hypothetical protein
VATGGQACGGVGGQGLTTHGSAVTVGPRPYTTPGYLAARSQHRVTNRHPFVGGILSITITKIITPGALAFEKFISPAWSSTFLAFLSA